MGRAKPKPEPTPEPASAAPANGQAGEVLSLAEAAAYLRLSEKDVLAAVTSQGLPARQMVSGEWRFLIGAIRQWLSVSQPTAEMRKMALLAAAGSLKDDPDLEAIVEEAMRRRGREPWKDGNYGGYRPAEKGGR